MTSAATRAGTASSDNVLHGVLLMICGLLILSSTDGVVKYLAEFFSPLTVAFFRFAVQLVIILAIAPFQKRSWRSLVKDNDPALVLPWSAACRWLSLHCVWVEVPAADRGDSNFLCSAGYSGDSVLSVPEGISWCQTLDGSDDRLCRCACDRAPRD